MPARSRIQRLAELLVLFLVPPVVIGWLAAAGARIPVLAILWGTGVPVALYLAWTAPAQLRAAILRPWKGGEVLRIGALLLVGAGGLLAYVLWVHPERLFEMPRQKPLAWAALIALYPPLSVLPQEILFRAFFFHRYERIWSGTGPVVLASALAFGLSHVFYGSWLAFGLATAGGVLFAWTYARTGSLALVVLEHSLYGTVLYTIGLGGFFLSTP